MPPGRPPNRPRTLADRCAEVGSTVAAALARRNATARVGVAPAGRPVAVPRAADGSTGHFLAGATSGPGLPGLVVTLDWTAWSAAALGAGRAAAAAARERVPAHVAVVVRHRVGARELVPAAVGAAVVGGCYAPVPEARMPAPLLIDEIVRVVRETAAPEGNLWEGALREALAKMLARVVPAEFKDGDLLTADRLNLIMNRLRELDAAVQKLQAAGTAAPAPGGPANPKWITG